MKKKNRLTRSRDFKRVKEGGNSLYHPLFVLVYLKNEDLYSRAAVVASKAVGNAVIRNKVRRRSKSCLDHVWQNIDLGWDLVFYSRAAIVGAKMTEICFAIQHLLKQAGVLGEKYNNNVS